jgi:hypothetical protein
MITFCGSVSLLLLAAGCSVRIHRYSDSQSSSLAASPGWNLPDEDTMVFRYESRDGHATLESPRVLLVFENINPEQQKAFHFENEEQMVQTGGDGISSVEAAYRKGKSSIRFHSAYFNGTNVIQFGDQTVRLIKNGRGLLAGDLSVDLSSGRKIVHLAGSKAWLE